MLVYVYDCETGQLVRDMGLPLWGYGEVLASAQVLIHCPQIGGFVQVSMLWGINSTQERLQGARHGSRGLRASSSFSFEILQDVCNGKAKCGWIIPQFNTIPSLTTSSNHDSTRGACLCKCSQESPCSSNAGFLHKRPSLICFCRHGPFLPCSPCPI